MEGSGLSAPKTTHAVWVEDGPAGYWPSPGEAVVEVQHHWGNDTEN